MMHEARTASDTQHIRLRHLAEDLLRLEAKLRRGGGGQNRTPAQSRQAHRARTHRTAARQNAFTQEIGLLVAYDEYKGTAPSAGVVTVLGRVGGREVVVVANDATVKAGSWWPETIKKILRAQEIAMRSHVPIIYLVDSAGVNLPYQGGVFPGQYGASRIFITTRSCGVICAFRKSPP
jgi:acetyl-CoA carboxylase carboxyltransferase component